MDIIICTCSGLMILVTDCFNTASGYIGSGSSQMAALAASGKNGIVFPQEAVGTLMPGLGEFVMGVVVILFAFTTILSYYYQAETGMAYLLGKASESKRKNVYLVMKIMVLLVYIYFSTTTSSVAWGAADLACGIESDATRHFTAEAPPRKLPPRPFSTIGANAYLRYKEWRAAAE